MTDFQNLFPLFIATVVLVLGAGSGAWRNGRATAREFGVAFLLLYAGWLAGLIEEIGAEPVFDLVEHGCHAVAAVLVAVACWRLCRRRDPDRS